MTRARPCPTRKPKAPATPETFRTQVLDVRTRKLLEEPSPRILFQLAAPNALVMLTQISFSVIELFFVGKLRVDALAGVSQVFPILSLVGAISQGAVGGGVVSAVARTLGRGDRALLPLAGDDGGAANRAAFSSVAAAARVELACW